MSVTSKNILRIIITILLVNIVVFANGQIKISNVYFELGYQDSKLTDFNKSLTEYPNLTTGDFDKLNGFKNIGAGFATRFKKIPRILIDYSIGYLFHTKQNREFMTAKEFSGFVYDSESAQFVLPPLDTVIYDYSFQINTLIFEISPSYRIFNTERFYLDLGIGLISYYSILNQDGINAKTDVSIWTTNQAKMTSKDFCLAWQSSIGLGYKFSNKFGFELDIKYRTGKSNEIGAENLLVVQTDNTSFFPVTKTKIDYSGLSYLLKLIYYL